MKSLLDSTPQQAAHVWGQTVGTVGTGTIGTVGTVGLHGILGAHGVGAHLHGTDTENFAQISGTKLTNELQWVKHGIIRMLDRLLGAVLQDSWDYWRGWRQARSGPRQIAMTQFHVSFRLRFEDSVQQSCSLWYNASSNSPVNSTEGSWSWACEQESAR